MSDWALLSLGDVSYNDWRACCAPRRTGFRPHRLMESRSAMMLQGHVVNGVIVTDEPCALPEGAIVQIEVVSASAPSAADEIPSLYDRLAPLIGAVDDLPE